MTTFLAAEKALLKEVRDRIVDLVPERERNQRFQYLDDAERELEEFEDETLTPRLFKIGQGARVDIPYIGAGYSHYLYEYPITIQYPAQGEHWESAINSDAVIIDRDFATNNYAGSGVQARYFKRSSLPLIERDPEDPWQRLTLTLTVLYEVTG